MAFLGDIGKFFSSGPAAIIFPPAAITVAAVGALAHGQNPVTAVGALYSPAPHPPAVTHSETLVRSLGEPVVAGAVAGGVSGSFFPEIGPGADIGIAGYSSDFYGGEPWQTGPTPSPVSLPSPVIIQQVSGYSPPASTPGLFQMAEGFLPILAAGLD